MDEFTAIDRFFTSPAPYARLGVGDDCAILPPCVHEQLVSSDLLLAGRHFFPEVAPDDLGHKALAVNLSDIAAMGGVARWFTLALALPHLDETWLSHFRQGLLTLADAHGVSLVGGDTTRGDVLSICITVGGDVPSGQAVTRAGACIGDEIWVSGVIGSAALALQYLSGQVALSADLAQRVLLRLHRPQPRLSLGQALRGIAHAMLDVSDGLAGDLRHILRHSRVGAVLDAAKIPCEAWLHAQPDWWARCVLSGGDDYELCFTAPSQAHAAVLAAGAAVGVSLTPIGHITAAHEGFQLRDFSGTQRPLHIGGFNHFAESAS